MPVSKKRKQRSTDIAEDVRENTKFAHFDQSSGETKDGLPWRNLQLILSLQDKNVDLVRKVDMAFDYVKSSSNDEMDDTSWRSQVLDTSRTIVFLNNWVQSVLISSEKKTRQEKHKPEFATIGSFLDIRCWEILHFGLEESKNLHITLTCSKDFFRVIHSIAMDALSCLNSMSLCCEERLQLYYTVLDCISLVFSFHGGVANENLDLWILLMDEVLKLILKIAAEQLDESKLGKFALQLSRHLFEPFAKFLRIHPTRKNGFHDFIDKILEPLLQLLHVLNSSSCGSNIEWRITSSKMVEEILAQALFHPTHIDGFLSLQSTVRYRNSSDATVKEEKLVNRSYHRHLFNKVEKIVADKNGLALFSLGEMLHLFVSCVTKHKGASVSNMDAEMRKSVFDYFVQIVEYLLAELNKYILSDGEAVTSLFNVSSTLRSINNLLSSFIHDKLYLRTEDTSEGASRNFLRVIYDTVMSFSAKIAQRNTSFGSDERSHLISVKKELIVAVHHLFDIEYEVVGNELESLWTMVFSSVACCYCSMDLLSQPSFSSEILSLGCRLIDLYSELRQVGSCIFALCRAVRQSLSLASDSSHSNSLSIFFCSIEFRLSLSNATKSIPEGQASGFIRQLSSDITESLEWIKVEITKSNEHSCDSLNFHLQAELLGKVLSEAYIIILDSITITSGNSYLVGVSVKNLIEIIKPSLCSLVSPQPDGSSKEFSILLNGSTLSNTTGCDNVSMCWILVVFFRILLSCKSLFRQAISFMPPDSSKKLSRIIGDSFIAHSGKDWLEMTGSADKGFFSWIIEPSETLLNVLHSVSDICIQDSVVLCSPMLYVLNLMALQRLVDLNRLIKSSEYMLQWNQTQGQAKLNDDDMSIYHKRIKKWKKSITKMRKEAEGLAKFMMGFISSTGKDKIFVPSYDHKNDALDFAVGSLDEKMLPSALWWIICRSVDIWCSHAAKKDLKKFLKLLIKASVSCVKDDEKVTAHKIAMEFLSNTISYEQKFVQRFMASRFGKILEKSILSIFSTSEVDLSESPDWVEVISAVENSPDLQIGSVPSAELNLEFARCQYLLTFLMRMPEEFLSLKSSSLYVTYILNLERLLVRSLLDWQSKSCSDNPHQIFRLFLTCRKVLQTLTVALSNETVNGNQSSFPLPWLLKSLLAVIGFQPAFPEGIAFEDKFAIFSLLDHTSNVLMTVSRDQFKRAISSIVSAKKHRVLSESNSELNPKENLGAWKNVLQLVETLEEYLQKSLITFRDESIDKKSEFLAESNDFNKLSSIVSCCQGLLWGLASTLGNTNAADSNFRVKFSSYNAESMTKIKLCVHTCVNFTTFFLKALFLKDDPMEPCEKKDDLTKPDLKRKLEVILTGDQQEKLSLKRSLLMEILGGENAEAAFFLKQLFISCSAIMRLNLQIDLNSISWSLFPIMVDISLFLLSEFSRSGKPHQSAFLCLDGVVKFLEELGNYFPQFAQSSSRDCFAKLISLHLRVIGKCISLQGKEAKLASQQTKKLTNQVQSCFSWETSRLGELKERLRMSFVTYIKKLSESTIQSVERALVGVQEGLITNYEIVCGSSNGGEVSTVVAAGIFALDLILEFVTGPIRLSMMKRYIGSFIASLFNIVLHLQGPTIFYGYADSVKAYEKPDSGSVILMCIEVLTKISGKPFFFQIDVSQNAESLRIPGALFQYFLQLQISGTPVKAGDADQKFSVELFAACCRMLCTALKHHKSETRQCISLLEDSVCVLLHCLEIVNIDGAAIRQSFAWEVQEAVKCASSLRRVYEEVRQQKDVFGQCSFQFLSRYIWVYCGFGPAKKGILREVDEALRPGVYALIDSCSADDLQLLHAVFGEGPCRSTLAALQHDYKINFQFEGKV